MSTTRRVPQSELHHALLTRLKLRQLSLLDALARHSTIARVATQMGLSQPAITMALREIEELFGSPLFERTAHGLSLTPAGESVLIYARRSLSELESTARVLESIQAGFKGRLRLGITGMVPQVLLSAVLMHLLASEPRVEVLSVEGATDDLVRRLISHELDFVIGRSYDGDARDLVQVPLCAQRPGLVVNAQSAKRLSRGPLDWSRLVALDWVLPPDNTPLRRTFNAVFTGAGLQPPVPILESVSVRSIGTVPRMNPNAITILARDVVEEHAIARDCAVLPYDLNWNLPPLCFLTTRDLERLPLVGSVRDALREAAARLNAEAGRSMVCAQRST
ncbi:LysR family transcriptional regulator [Cupriavidus consociatus]|uniref:LysR family transcriptional regulator n=1 Tax=Cupriavidus consociatus TaxID=2821357 RepID=UPI001AE7F7B7|nr:MULTISPECIES: LysR family transcriptional regulator [unclassified Cupriavidus]MBP0625200.1 LysR family transcriptional regulator [Cupriavidus sp. LEh25]MDK2661940.1 LysR family transcriptional regulator [Cupriavidus sp. LEh21]